MDIEVISNSPSLEYAVHYKRQDEVFDNYIEFSFHHTFHSFKRAAQRGLQAAKLSLVLEYGETVCKQGVIFYILGENNIPDHMRKQCEKIKNTVVVVSGDTGCVITCYRSVRAFKNIKHKIKYFVKDLKYRTNPAN